MKRIVKLLFVSLAVVSVGSVYAQDGVLQQQGEQGRPVTTTAPAQDPTQIPAENTDGTPVDPTIQNEAVAAATAYRAATDAGDPDAMDAAKQTFEDLHRRDPKNLSVITWLGYIYSAEEDHASAVRMLEMARGKSKSRDVNLTNLRTLSLSYYLAQDYAKAIPALNELDQAAPNDAQTVSLLGSAYVLNGNYAQAVPHLERARTLLNDDPQSLRNVSVDLAIAYDQTNQKDKALGLFDTILANDDVAELLDAQQLAWIGYMYLQAGQNDKAIPVLEQARRADPNNPSVLNNLATAYKNDGRDEEAINAFSALLQAVPDNAEAAFNLGTLYLKREQYSEAAAHLARSVNLRRDAAALNNLGRAYEGQGMWRQAADSYSQASDMERGNAAFAVNAAAAHLQAGNEEQAVTYLERARAAGSRDSVVGMNLAVAHYRMGNYQEAYDTLASLEQGDVQNDADYWFNLAISAQKLGKREEAKQHFERVLTLREGDHDSTNNLALIRYEDGDYPGALEMYRELSAKAPNDVQLKLNMAACHAKMGQWQQSIEIWRNVVRGNPDRHAVRLDLADALWNTGDTPGARFHYAYVHEREASNPRALNGLGLWALLQNEATEAESLFRRAVRADRSFLPAYPNLAVALERLGRVNDAIKVLEAGKAVAPDDQKINETLTRLQSSR